MNLTVEHCKRALDALHSAYLAGEIDGQQAYEAHQHIKRTLEKLEAEDGGEGSSNEEPESTSVGYKRAKRAFAAATRGLLRFMPYEPRAEYRPRLSADEVRVLSNLDKKPESSPNRGILRGNRFSMPSGTVTQEEAAKRVAEIDAELARGGR